MSVPIYKPIITEFETTESLFAQAVNLLEDKILEVHGQFGLVRLLLSGGSTPLPVYEQLGRNPILPWSETEIYQSDERYIDKNSPLSNQKRLRESFGPTWETCRTVTFNTDFPREMTVQDYQEHLEELDGTWFDQAILGIGEDGHFASLFPRSKYLGHQEQAVVATQAPAEFEVEDRISLTPESVLNSEDILVLLVGNNKKDILTELLEGSKSVLDFPAKILLSHPRLNIYCYFGEE